jgi:integrase
MARLVKLGRDARGNYKKDLGNPQRRFYLGRDSLEAQTRALKLEKLWACVETAWQHERKTERPEWDEYSSAIGLAVARGDEQAAIPFPADLSPVAALNKFRELEATYPGFRLVPAASAAAKVEEGREGVRHALDVDARAERFSTRPHQEWLLQKPTADLSAALDGYVAHVKKHYTRDDQLSEYGHVELKYVELLRPTLTGTLADLDSNKIDDAQCHWEHRPQGARGKLAVATCQKAIKVLFRFLSWLDKQPKFGWRWPTDYKRRKPRIYVTQAEQAERIRPKSFTVEQLASLYKFATPFERALMLLALNCGFAQREIATLQINEVHLDEPHPHFNKPGNWIRRIRKKTGVYAEWRLWPETAEAIAFLKRSRPSSKLGELVLTRHGNPLHQQTAGGNANQAVANAWGKLNRRIRKEQDWAGGLGFKYLRKTASSLIRRLSSGETASMFLAHGRATSDELLDVYAQRPFGRVFRALRLLRKKLAPMLAHHTPFPETAERRASQGRGELSLAKQRRIAELKAQGYQLEKIMELVGVGRASVYKYAKRAE